MAAGAGRVRSQQELRSPTCDLLWTTTRHLHHAELHWGPYACLRRAVPQQECELAQHCCRAGQMACSDEMGKTQGTWLCPRRRARVL